jgi:polygalacturonase
MASQLQLRRGTTAQHAVFTGAPGEVTVDTDKKVPVVHDGATVGGFPVEGLQGKPAGGGLAGTYPNPTIAPIVATGSTTARTLANRFAETVNVKDFGAAGDGVADDTAAINAAAAYLTSIGGGVLYFPRGTYLKDANFTYHTNVSFVGEDKTSVTVKARAATADGSGALLNSVGNNLTISNITFDCNWQTLRAYGKIIGAMNLDGNNCTVKKCRVIQFGGSGKALVESFPIVIRGRNAIIRDNVVELPVVGIGAVFTGSINGTTLTVTSITSGTIGINKIGELLLSSGSILEGTLITAQISGTAGGVGTYTVNQSQNQPSATLRQTEQGTYATYISLFGTSTQQQVRSVASSDASNNTLSVGFPYFQNGHQVRFLSITGGSPFAIDTTYYVVGVNGNNFQLSLTPNGSPIDFTTITAAVIGRIDGGGNAWIQNNSVVGSYPEGTATNYNQPNQFYEGSMGIIAGGTFDTLYVQNNHIVNIGAGFNGDSWNNGNLIIESNYFRNCQRSINITFGDAGDGGLGVLRRLDNLRVHNNTFRQSINNIIGGVAGRFTYVNNVFVTSNYLDTYDGTAGPELGWYVSRAKQAVFKDNVIHTNIQFNGNEFGPNVDSWVSENNTDQNGIQRFEYCRNARSCIVRGNKSVLLNGLELTRALLAAKGANPNYVEKSATNRFAVYVDAGEYDISAGTSNTGEDVAGNFNVIDGVDIVGLCSPDSIRIKNSQSYTFNISSQSDYITFKNITIVGATGRVALQQSNGIGIVFENIIFEKEGSGTIVASGAWTHRAKFIRCFSAHPFYGSNTQGVFGGECYECQWLGGFSAQGLPGTNAIFKDTTIVGRLFNLTEAANVTIENCRIYAPSGETNPNILLSSNCLITNTTFKNTRLVFSGSGNEVYNCIFNMDAAQDRCIAEASGQTAAVKIFNVGSNKPVDTNLTITSLDQYNLTNVLSGTGAPSATAPNGSIYLRTDGDASSTVYVRAGDQWRPLGAYEP